MASLKSHPFTVVKPTPAQERSLEIASIAFMNDAPFYAHAFYSLGRLVLTRDIATAATDGRHVVLNPDYLCSLPTKQQVFVLAHEMDHLVCRHPQRFLHYTRQGHIKGKPAVLSWANICADYVINANLVASKIGAINPEWLYDPTIKGTELWEDVYDRTLKVIPPPKGTAGGGKPRQGDQGKQGNPPPGQQQGQGNPPPGQDPGQGLGQGGAQEATTEVPGTCQWKDGGKSIRGAKGDPMAAARGGSFDELLPPPVDPVTGAEDLPDEAEFREEITRAAAAAKAMGKLPDNIQRLVEELLTPQVDWREHIRMLVTGKIGARHETWARPNRRRLVLNPIVITPGRKGYGAECVVVAVDTSGSIGGRELDAFFAEVGGILNDCKPRRIIVIGCDARVSQVDEVRSLDEFEGLRAKGIKGGGGTRFEPVFEYVTEHELRPETLVYLSDGLGSYPSEAPPYPTVWTLTTDVEPPWGEVVRISLDS